MSWGKVITKISRSFIDDFENLSRRCTSSVEFSDKCFTVPPICLCVQVVNGKASFEIFWHAQVNEMIMGCNREWLKMLHVGFTVFSYTDLA